MHGSWQSTDRSGVDAPVPGDPVGAVIESSPKPPARREFSFRASRQRAANRIEAGTQTDGDPQEGLRRAGNRGYAIRSAGRFWGETDPRMTVATTVWLAGYGRLCEFSSVTDSCRLPCLQFPPITALWQHVVRVLPARSGRTLCLRCCNLNDRCTSRLAG